MKYRLNTPISVGEVNISEKAQRLPRETIEDALERHRHCDWGNISLSDWMTNNRKVLDNGMPITSVYIVGKKALLVETWLTITTVKLINRGANYAS